ncbi:uncharacterized protein C1orf112 homolog isoform X2 [Harmonia axyridis]|uniref:uncharacterized protein C1orf112 homolog isoform X2 n=1 Tax=Harmonia axyridis TaxID=115357 RepID=UPI001E2797F0|nr:uncharacterized protein C1orf112 homolog isoform X2 [Harmonia axyridis]
METDNCPETIMEETKSIFKRASTSDLDKKIIYNALQDFRTHFKKLSLEKLEKDFMFYMMPCIKDLFFEIYRSNDEMDSIQKVEELLGNLTITISLTNFIEELLNCIASQLESTNLNLLKTMILEIPKCLFLTYNHCKRSQKKYQNLMNDCKEILLLYKKNQECHMKFLNIITIIAIDAKDENSTKILIDSIQSISNITEILFGLNIKALADSWKSYCCVIEKHQEILAAEKFYCIREIELLGLQIRDFMNIALESNDDKQLLQYLKLSGFLLKVALKIINNFWQFLNNDHLECIHNLVCSIYNFSPEISDTYKLTVNVKNAIQTCLLDVSTSFVEEKLLQRDILEKMLSKLSSSKSDLIGCLEFNMKILEFINRQIPDDLDYSFFASIVNLIFINFSIWFPEPYSEDVMKHLATIIEKLSSHFSKSIEAHNSFYNEDFESVIFSNILGNNIGCHILASTTWVQIISKLSSESRKNVITELLQVINNSQIELSFTSLKIIFLKKFMHKLFNSLDEEERVYFLNLYPPLEYKCLWRIIGPSYNTENETLLLNPLLEFLSLNLKDVRNSASAQEIIESVEALKMFAGASKSSLEINGKTLCNIVLTLWELNFEEVPSNNLFLKYFISCLSEVTVKLMNYFSTDQVVSILKRMEMLATNNLFKVKLCLMLSAMSTKQAEHNMEQNKLNFVISDLFELLLRENDEMIKEI